MNSHATEFKAGTLTYSRRTLLKACSWLLTADLGLAFRARALGPMIQFLLKGFGVSNQTLAWVTVTLPQGLSILVQPVVAHYSDRCRTRWGRRLPFIFVSAPILAVTMAAMGLSPLVARLLHGFLGASSPGEQACGLIFFIIVFIVFDVAALTQGRTWSGLLNDVLPHGVLGRYMAASRITGLIVGVVFNQFFLAQVQHYQVLAFLVLSGVYASTMLVLVLNIREGDYPPPPPAVESKGLKALWDNTRGFLKECYGHPYYRWVMLMLCIDDIAFGAVNTFSLFHAKSLEMSLQTYGSCVAAQFVIGLLLAYPIGMLADRFHPFRVSAVALVLYGAFALWSGLFISDATTFVIGFMAHGVLGTSYNTAAASMPFRLLARSRFAVLAAGQSILASLLQMVVTPMLGILLDLTHSEYRYTYLVGFGYVVVGIPIYIIVYRKFRALGGVNHYKAPDDDTPEAGN